jgi:hypothetical protein
MELEYRKRSNAYMGKTVCTRLLLGISTVVYGLSVLPPVQGQVKPKIITLRPPPTTAVKLSVGAPLTQGNLTVFPVYSNRQQRAGGDYHTLGEALKQKLIAVKELPDAEVSRVNVTSRSTKPIYLMSGDIILGGQQDRVIARDTIIPTKAQEFAVEVFCVEHGRWNGGRHFGGNEVASTALRRVAQRSKQQDKVWARVAEEAAATKSETGSGTYRAVAENKELRQQVAIYTTSLSKSLGKDQRALGLVLAINGDVTSADVFADPGLFRKQLPKILNSYALDAAQSRGQWIKLTKKPNPSRQAAQQLLKDADRGNQRTTA